MYNFNQFSKVSSVALTTLVCSITSSFAHAAWPVCHENPEFEKQNKAYLEQIRADDENYLKILGETKAENQRIHQLREKFKSDARIRAFLILKENQREQAFVLLSKSENREAVRELDRYLHKKNMTRFFADLRSKLSFFIDDLAGRYDSANQEISNYHLWSTRIGAKSQFCEKGDPMYRRGSFETILAFNQLIQGLERDQNTHSLIRTKGYMQILNGAQELVKLQADIAEFCGENRTYGGNFGILSGLTRSQSYVIRDILPHLRQLDFEMEKIQTSYYSGLGSLEQQLDEALQAVLMRDAPQYLKVPQLPPRPTQPEQEICDWPDSETETENLGPNTDSTE